MGSFCNRGASVNTHVITLVGLRSFPSIFLAISCGVDVMLRVFAICPMEKDKKALCKNLLEKIVKKPFFTDTFGGKVG